MYVSISMLEFCVEYYARVFPLPVTASTTTSEFFMNMGMAACCTGVVLTKPMESTASRIHSDKAGVRAPKERSIFAWGAMAGFKFRKGTFGATGRVAMLVQKKVTARARAAVCFVGSEGERFPASMQQHAQISVHPRQMCMFSRHQSNATREENDICSRLMQRMQDQICRNTT